MIKKLRQFATNLLIMSKEVFEKVYAAANENRIFEAVYNEYGKLDEMHPKLKALIAAGLIGTAGLGMQSCNMAPDDDPYYEMPSGEETQLSEFEQACEDIGIPHELGNRLKSKGERNVCVSDMIDCGFSVSVYEDEKKGFVPAEEKHFGLRGLGVDINDDYYIIPKKDKDTDTDAYKLFYPVN